MSQNIPPSVSVTPSVTPSETPTSTVTPTPSVTPSMTPSPSVSAFPGYSSGVYYVKVFVLNDSITCEAMADENSPTFTPSNDVGQDNQYAAIRAYLNYNPQNLAKATMDSLGNVTPSRTPYIMLMLNDTFLQHGGSANPSPWQDIALSCPTTFPNVIEIDEETDESFPCSFDEDKYCICGEENPNDPSPDDGVNKYPFNYSYESIREQCFEQWTAYNQPSLGLENPHQGTTDDPFEFIIQRS